MKYLGWALTIGAGFLAGLDADLIPVMMAVAGSTLLEAGR